MAGGAGYAVAVKLTREGEAVLASEWLAGVLPSLVCATVLPLFPFFSRRSVRVGDFLGVTLFTTVGLCVYEFAQIGMPRRTFDWDDIGATVVGGTLALMLGLGFFLFSGKRPGK
jgi:hypothetical protein